ncbi:Nucleoside diphosphate-linked moiety X motif 19, mitochondrial [Blomia tropicalis]|nr:Nucleoside diphosphate-linked moiety X motif 19, mitochondrial [Blomia tropicalis]
MVENQTQTFHLDSNWLESVNILLVRPTTKSSDYDYELCNIESFSAEFIQNRIKRRFLPTINLMESDFAPEWWTILNETVDNFKEEQNKSNFILSNVDNQTRQKAIKQFGQKVLDSSLALRIAAIRCLFQELGILLVVTKEKHIKPCTLKQISKVHKEMYSDQSNFIKIFEIESILRPKIESLFEWSNWLTPSTIGRSPRYDTLFYLCVIDELEDKLIEIEIVQKGDRQVYWNTLEKLLDGFHQQMFCISPSHLYELTRLTSHPWFKTLKLFAKQRQSCGVERWQPSISLYSNGTISFLPGDQFYPDHVDLCLESRHDI